MPRICGLPAIKKSDASSLRQLINHVSSHMNALQALSVDVPIQDLMLNHLLLSFLDAETQREWELITASREDIPSTSGLITFLESRCRALELLQNTPSVKTDTASPRLPPTYGGKVSKPSYSNVVTQTQCTLCNGPHRLFKLTNFSNYNLSNAFTLPNNEDCASIVCNYLTRTTPVQSKCVTSAKIVIILCCI